MTAEQIREGVAAALMEVLQDDDILRDLFAAAVAAGIAANPAENRTIENITESPYAAADAILASRNRLKKRPPDDSKKR